MSGFEPRDPEPARPSPMRIGIWIAVSGVGLYFLVSGVIGLINGGA